MIPSSMYYRALLGLSFVAFVPPSLHCQSLDHTVTVGRSPLLTQLNMMKLSSRLRLQTQTGRQEGRLSFRSADSLGVRGVEGRETHLLCWPLTACGSAGIEPAWGC